MYQHPFTTAGALEVFFNAVLRDILPDKPFKVHSMNLLAYFSTPDASNFTSVRATKNIPAEIKSVPDVELTQHGHIAQLVVSNDYRYGQAPFLTFDPPLDFDKDDSLNIRMFLTNGVVGANNLYGELIILYEEG